MRAPFEVSAMAILIYPLPFSRCLFLGGLQSLIHTMVQMTTDLSKNGSQMTPPVKATAYWKSVPSIESKSVQGRRAQRNHSVWALSVHRWRSGQADVTLVSAGGSNRGLPAVMWPGLVGSRKWLLQTPWSLLYTICVPKMLWLGCAGCPREILMQNKKCLWLSRSLKPDRGHEHICKAKSSLAPLIWNAAFIVTKFSNMHKTVLNSVLS